MDPDLKDGGVGSAAGLTPQQPYASVYAGVPNAFGMRSYFGANTDGSASAGTGAVPPTIAGGRVPDSQTAVGLGLVNNLV